MGNSNSASKEAERARQYGGIFVQLNNRVLVPNETVSGTIYLNLVQDYPGSTLYISVLGDERVHFIDRVAKHKKGRNGQRKTYYVDVHRRAHRSILNKSFPVYSWGNGGIIPRGQYSFPFSFLVPQGLPGSMYLCRNRAQGSIAYSMEAYLQPSNSNIPKLGNSMPIIVREAVIQNIQTQQVKKQEKIKTCCCCDRGVVAFSTFFEKNAYAPTETARASAEIDNSQCKNKINDVVFSLEQSIVLRAGAHSKVIRSVIKSQSLGGLEAGESWIGDKLKIASIELPPGQEGSFQHFEDGQEIKDDPNAAGKLIPSSHGGIITSDFFLKMELRMDGCLCCQQYPSATIPIQVYSAALKPIELPQAPQGWNPVVMNPYTFVIQIDPGMMQPNQMMAMNQGMQTSQMPMNQMTTNQMPMNQMPMFQPNQVIPSDFVQGQQMNQAPMMNNPTTMPNYNQPMYGQNMYSTQNPYQQNIQMTNYQQ